MNKQVLEWLSYSGLGNLHTTDYSLYDVTMAMMVLHEEWIQDIVVQSDDDMLQFRLTPRGQAELDAFLNDSNAASDGSGDARVSIGANGDGTYNVVEGAAQAYALRNRDALTQMQQELDAARKRIAGLEGAINRAHQKVSEARDLQYEQKYAAANLAMKIAQVILAHYVTD